MRNLQLQRRRQSDHEGHRFQVLLTNWVKTVTMLAGIGGIIVLLWYRRPGSSPGEDDGGLEREEPTAAPAAATA